jgi:hypothetical protein
MIARDFQPCAEVLATLRREIGGMDGRIERLKSSRSILVGYLRELT